MVKRKQVGIIYSYDENWIGGTYYIQNLVSAMNLLPDALKPDLVILCKTEKEFCQLKQTGYPYLEWQVLHLQQLTIWERVKNKLHSLLFGYDLFYRLPKMGKQALDAVFPAYLGMHKQNMQAIYWIPDFQEQKLPGFFTPHELKIRKMLNKYIASSRSDVVFSSEDACGVFTDIFPASKVKKHIIPFAVSHPDEYRILDFEILKEKYSLHNPFYFVSNQFWKHKNHIVVLKAVLELVKQGITNFQVAFSGKESDYRNPLFFAELQSFIQENGIGEYIRFLGFIDRAEQLKLMSEAVAIIQPSLYEGWSTVVEDAKAMNQYIIASDLPVHKEQINGNASFFPPDNEKILADILKEGFINGFVKESRNYAVDKEKFAKKFIAILS